MAPLKNEGTQSMIINLDDIRHQLRLDRVASRKFMGLDEIEIQRVLK